MTDEVRVGKYVLGPCIGHGGMGAVYRARDPDLNRPCAIKIVSDGARALEGVPVVLAELRAELRREARIAARLMHPNIVQVYEVGTDRGLDFIAMEYVEGPSLHQLLTLVRGPQPPTGVDPPAWTRAILRHMVAVCRAVDFAHEKKILHRDIKPSNLLAVPDPDDASRVSISALKVADFGTSLDLSVEATRGYSSFSVGTPAYVSPERARGRATGFVRAVDIFSLGATLYEIVEGRNPFQRDNVQETLQAVLKFDPPPPGGPGPLADVILRAIAKDPFDRYLNAEELAEALEDALSGRASAPPTRSQPRTGVTEAVRPGAREAKAAYERGLEHQRNGALEEALREFNAAVAGGVGSTARRARMRRAEVFYAFGLVGDAIADWKWVANDQPQAVEPRFNMGLAHRRLGQLDQALNRFLEAMQVAPETSPLRAQIERSIEKTKRLLEDSP